MPQNIKINNVRSLDAKVLLDEYYDFMLYKGGAYGADTSEECLAADFSSFDIDEATRDCDLVIVEFNDVFARKRAWGFGLERRSSKPN